jgi:hypothetical protein
MLQLLAKLACTAAIVAGGAPVARAGAEPAELLLVLPVLDPAPPELALPGARLWVESLLLELGGAPLRVEPLEPAGQGDPAGIEREARARGLELGADAVLWARLVPPAAGCPAPRILRLVLLDPATGESVQRDLCPETTGEAAGLEELARAMALAALHALQAGELPGLVLAAPSKVAIEVAPTCPECPVCVACPACPTPTCPALAEPGRGLLRLRVGGAFSSQPSWVAASLGPELALAWAPLDWLEVGVGAAVYQGRRVRVAQVDALHASVPLQVWVAGLWGLGSWQLGLDVGLQASWTRLDALLPELGTTAVVERWNPAILGRVLGRYWTPWNFAIQLEIGSSVHLRHQRYVVGRGTAESTVLTMQTVSFEAGLGLVIPLVQPD